MWRSMGSPTDRSLGRARYRSEGRSCSDCERNLGASQTVRVCSESSPASRWLSGRAGLIPRYCWPMASRCLERRSSKHTSTIDWKHLAVCEASGRSLRGARGV